jgi:hypothetical protein
MLLYPVIVSIHTVSPDVGLFWDKLSILHITREENSVAKNNPTHSNVGHSMKNYFH